MNSANQPQTAKGAKKRKSQPDPETSETKTDIDVEFSAHAKFLQQMAIYRTLKYAIKRADIGLIRRIFVQCVILFHWSNKSKYAFLSLYMTWLTHTKAVDKKLQNAILANGLVNLRGAEDSWFEMDRLNEFFNLQMKTLLATRRTSTLGVTTLFQQTALTASYCTGLKEAIERAFRCIQTQDTKTRAMGKMCATLLTLYDQDLFRNMNLDEILHSNQLIS
jgi:hypothetical protein